MTLSDPGFFITYSLVQLIVLLLLIRFLDLYEREPLSVVAVMTLWGGTGAVALGLAGREFISSHVHLLPELHDVFRSALAAPAAEEIAKGLALVVGFARSWWAADRFDTYRFDGVTDGIVYGAAVGLGF